MSNFIFGFLDNYLMVVFGQQIDEGIERLPGVGSYISKLPDRQRAFYVAGLGNTVSDFVGVLTADLLVDNITAAMGLPDEGVPNRTGATVGAGVGIVLGCLAGMLAGIHAGKQTALISGSAVALASLYGASKRKRPKM